MQFYRHLGSINALTFDLDDTLYDNHPVIVRAEQAMFDWLAQLLPSSTMISRDDWQHLKQQLAVIDPSLTHDVSQWRYETLKIGLMQLGWRLQAAELAARQGLELVLVERNKVDVPAETHRVLALLSAQLPLVAITNGNVDPQQIGLAKYFSAIYQAGRDGLAKPAADLFEHAINHLGLPAQQVLHVGDHLQTDVFGAKKHGLQACWYNDQRRTLTTANVNCLPDVEISHLAELLPLIGIPAR
ncbi:5-amino-6-(5-phospho-D-ribitylamino)uracil phosphatase YigB [Photobacterium aquimaris]|uniref:5-amino-6-(5-phospho-D-ribitylamino)uracil phosphatase YigB n=1 Tax=Photobacterium aquimaris TaxID=512643 RepID=A0A2T3HYJ8_9GAMM|nr:5-amino-6-(5-phospho-D-ribitylamino)uracil phosphatase YigB [Photobacterium aquimaris]MCP4955638.1 5-amino-6-(5-phospho-D-ribitylamino)uracil phosphatase YigB [Photobacterium aquimaris]OBU24789.1 2-haloalkanoic acid dehalogenase [Photobacterium aquimaris]PQJ36734.1 2-haloalkanoic acid dehalogenase [Photobacterium aquimaris]PSU05258.1 5-amino-6-(5-phospho-D-ribitylamino)uracil phosphatase YigB [Photobacterium aquimaris]